MYKHILIILVSILTLTSCADERHGKTPLDELIKKLDAEKNFTIILYDMEEEGTFSPTYKHQYKVITNGPDSIPVEAIQEWVEVPEDFFIQHENDMGMEIAAKKNGVVSKQTAPAGYTNYVGNTQYGTWKSDASGNSFWEFYGKYAMMSSMIGMMSAPLYRTSYIDYDQNYRGQRPYYGNTINGVPEYGTYSAHNASQNRKYTTNNKFKERVQNSTTRSTNTTIAGQRSVTSPSQRSDRKSFSRPSSTRSFSRRRK
jgi:hypothetical protein